MPTLFRTARLALGVLSLLTAGAAVGEPIRTSSPGGAIMVEVDVDAAGAPHYRVLFQGAEVIAPSRLGLRFANAHGLDEGLSLIEAASASRDETWEQPWGERRFVRDRHEEALLTFARDDAPARRFSLRVRVFDDGVGFRYEVPEQAGVGELRIVDELTEFRVEPDATAWSIPARQWNRYEYLYRTTPVRQVQNAHTPFTLRMSSGVHVSIHEAALVDYAAMVLEQHRDGVFEADLTPWSDGLKVRAAAPFVTPWRTVQIAADAVGLLNSDLILNLNEPNALGDVSWVEPAKYVGIWWAMHIRDRSWGQDTIHGATTEEAKRYIDFAAEHGFAGVLIEGWNIGWDGDWYASGEVFDFTRPYPDFDIKAVTDYALSKGVRLIGHHETSGAVTHYEDRMEAAFDFYERRGVRQVKTGYVADAGELERKDEDGVIHYEWHDGQYAARHHLKNVREAAKRKIAINTHEPIKDTGLRRTYPNWISREGARGSEYDAWGLPPNTPEHTAILPYTRMLSGPMDYTPGLFDLRPNERPPLREDMTRNDPRSRIETTLAKQLALYVTLYSPIQMAADLPENYEARPEPFQFIKDVAVDWEESRALQGEVGDFVVFARKARKGGEWFLGGVTDEEAREVTVPLDFLEPGRFVAEIYRDGEGAHWETNPYAMIIEDRPVTAKDALVLPMAPGGGFAVRLRRAEG